MEEAQEKKEALLPLDLTERVIVFHHGGQAYRHVFRRITAHLAAQYFNLVALESEGAKIRVDMATAHLWLYQAAIMRAEGYQVRGGGRLEELSDWKRRIPRGHRLSAVDLLTKITEHEPEGPIVLEPETETVLLDAHWSEGDPGRLPLYCGLVHRFRIITDEHERRFNRAVSESIVVGGSRTGRTIHPSRQRMLLRLYDELIESVEGYSVGGSPLAGAEAIRREMDPFHKAAAMNLIFSARPAAQEDEAEAEE
jgi:hypothetical protein